MSIKAKIFSAVDLRRETAKVPEWGVDLVLVQMNGKQLSDYRTAVAELEGVAVAAALVVFSAQDEAGVAVFTMDDMPEFLKKSPSVIKRVSEVAGRVNALDTTIEDAKKN